MHGACGGRELSLQIVPVQSDVHVVGCVVDRQNGRLGCRSLIWQDLSTHMGGLAVFCWLSPALGLGQPGARSSEIGTWLARINVTKQPAAVPNHNFACATRIVSSRGCSVVVILPHSFRDPPVPYLVRSGSWTGLAFRWDPLHLSHTQVRGVRHQPATQLKKKITNGLGEVLAVCGCSNNTRGSPSDFTCRILLVSSGLTSVNTPPP
jgi:hypothetical protein